MMTCSSWPRSARTRPVWGSSCTLSSMSAPRKPLSMRVRSVITRFRSSTVGCSTCCRVNASSWRVIPAARVAAFTISDTSERGVVVLRQALEYEPAETDHGGHHVVDLVGQATRQVADRLDALRLPQVVCCPAIVFHIGAGPHPLHQDSLGVEHGNTPRDDPPILAVMAQEAVLGVVGLLPLNGSPPGYGSGLSIVRMNGIEPSPAGVFRLGLSGDTPPRSNRPPRTRPPRH